MIFMTNQSGQPARLTSFTLEVYTEREFCALLRAVWKNSGLTLGQAAIKTGIRRSQIHGLTREGRSRLPRLRTQVEALISACGLPVEEAEHILVSWDRLRKRDSNRR
ncbi:helix-turn-helix domain-containing protein [Amycolatopsis sp. NPDC004378]